MFKISFSQILKFFFFILFFKAVISIVIPKIVLTGFLFLLLLSLFTKQLFKVKINKSNLLVFILMILLFLNFTFSIVFNRDIIEINYAVISTLQLVFSLILIQVFSNLSSNTYRKVVLYVSKLSFFFIIVGLVEYSIPKDIMSRILVESHALINGTREILVSYHFGDFNIGRYRLGSLFFEPLSFAFVSGAYFIWYLSRFEKTFIKSTIGGVVHFFALGKMPIIISVLSVISGFLRKYAILFYLLIFVVLITIIYSIPNKALLQSPSMGFHIIGFKKGVENGISQPFTGHGLGTAGYNIYLASKGKKNPFIHTDNYGYGQLNNGNESAVGVMLYQTGFVFTFLYLMLLLNIAHKVYRGKNYLIFGLFMGYIISLFLLESPLSVVITSVVFLFTFSTLKNNEI